MRTASLCPQCDRMPPAWPAKYACFDAACEAKGPLCALCCLEHFRREHPVETAWAILRWMSFRAVVAATLWRVWVTL